MKGKTLYISIAVLAVMLIGFVLVFMKYNSPLSSKPVLTVSIQPQRYFLEKIVGDKYQVVCMLAQGSNPETYEPSFNHLMNLEKSDAYFCIGNIGFELAILDKVKVNNPDLPIIDCSKGIDYLRGTHGGVLAHKCGHEHSHEIDPHVWTSVINAKIIVENMYNAVVKMDSHNKDYYTKNYDALQNELSEMQSEFEEKLIAAKGMAFAVWHPSLSYFARDFGMKQIAMENEGKEVSAGMLKEEIDLARDNNVKILFYQKEFDNRQIQLLNQQIGGDMVEINPMSYEWADEMKNIVNALVTK